MLDSTPLSGRSLRGILEKLILGVNAAALMCLIMTSSPARGGSVLSLPLPDDIPVYTDKEQYNRYMTLEIKMPESFKDPNPVKKKEPKRRNFDYFEFQPYRKVDDDPEMHRAIRSLIAKGLDKKKFAGATSSRRLYRKGALDTTWTMGSLIRDMLNNFLDLSDEAILRDSSITRETLEDMKYLAKKFKHELFMYNFNPDNLYNRIEEVRKLMKFNQGVVRVVKVENDMKGGTILHFVVKENQFEKE